MKNINKFLIIFILLLSTFGNIFSANISSAGTGNWNTPATWVGGVVPGAGDNVTIVGGHTVTATASITVNNIIIQTGATFAAGNYTHTITGNWTEEGTGQMTGTSTIEMSAPLIQSITAAATFYNLSFNGGGIGVLGANVTVTNDFLVTNNTEVKTSQSNTFQANFTVDNGSKYIATAGTTTFNSSLAQTITIGTTNGNSNVEFQNAYFDNGGAGNPKTINGNMIANGQTYIFDDAELGDVNNDKTHTIYGGMRIDGTCAFTGKIIAMGGTIFDENDHAITLNAELVSKYLYIGSSTSPLALTTNENVTVGIEDNVDYNYLVVSNGSTLTGVAGKTLLVKNSKRLYIRDANNFPTGFGTITLEESSFVVYDDNANQTINNNVTYGHLYLNNTAGNSTTKTAGGGLTVMGNIYIYNSSTLSLVNYDHHFKGHIVNNNDANGNGSITTTGGTVYLDAPDSDQYIYNAGTGSYTFNNLTITNTAPSTSRNKRLYDNITVNGNLIVSNSGGNEANRVYFDINDFTITGGNNFNLSSYVWLLTSGTNTFQTSMASFGGTATLDINSTVRFDRTDNGSSQNIPGGFTYGNIELYGSNNKIPLINLDINGNVSAVGYVPVLTESTNLILRVAGDWNMSFATTNLTGGNSIIFDGVNQDISQSNFSFVYFSGSGTKTISGTLDILRNLVIQTGVTVEAGTRNVFIEGSWSEQGTGQFHQTTGMVTFDGTTANQTILTNASSHFYNFTINKTGANKIVTINSDIDINGTFDFAEHNASFNMNNHNIHVARDFYFREGCTFTHNNGKAFFDGNTDAQLIRNYNTDTIVFNDVEFVGTAVKRLYENAFRFEGDVFINNSTLDGQWWDHYVEGNWINTGIFRHSRTLYFDGANQNISQSSFHSVRFGGGANTKTLTGNINLSGDLWIDDATLDVSASNYSITLDDYWHNDSTGSFIPRQGTVVVTGEYNRIFTGKTNTLYAGTGQVITQGGAKDFYNLTINATNEDYWMFIHGELKVINDFKIIQGRFFQSYEPAIYGINDIYIGGSFINKGSIHNNNYGEKIEFDTNGGTHIFDPGTSNSYGPIFFTASTTHTFQSSLNFYSNRALTISNGNLDLNSNKITTHGNLGNITMSGGSLEIDSAAIVSMGNGSTFSNTGGLLKIIGHNDDPASLIATSGHFTYTQTTAASRIHTKNFRIEGTSGDGINIAAASHIGDDATGNYSFENGSFAGGTGNAYLTISGVDLGAGGRTATAVTFNSGPTDNVVRTSGTGVITFENATGTLAGASHENDSPDGGETTGNIHWTYTNAARWTGAAGTTDWHTANNWSPVAVPTSTTFVILDHTTVGGAYSVDITSAPADAKTLLINSGGNSITLTLNGQMLTVVEDITIDPNSTLTQTNAGDRIIVGGSWSNEGTFNPGASTVEFNPITGTHTITAKPTDFFNNFVVNGTGGTNVISSSIDINGNVELQGGTLNAGTNTITVAGNWTRSGGAVFNVGTSTVNFDNVGVQSINGGEFYNLIISNPGAGTFAKTATANIDINNDLTIGSGTVFDGGTNIVYVGRHWTNNVGNAGFTQTGAGTVIFDGESSDQNISTGQSTTFNDIIISGTRVKRTKNNITINGNLIITSASLYITDGTIIDGVAGINNAINMSDGRIYVNGNFDGTTPNTNNFPINFETINLSGGIVDYYANTNQTVYSTTYYSLMVRRINAGNTTTKTLSGDITVNGSLYINDNETTLNVDNHTINLWGGLSLATGGIQINWGPNGTLNHFGEYFTVDADIINFNNVIKKNRGYFRVVYNDITVAGDMSILEDAYLYQDTVNITSTGAGKIFTLAPTAFVYSYNHAAHGKAFPVNFSTYNIHKDSRVYLRGTVGDQDIYTVPNYGNFYLYTHAEINQTLDGNLDVEGNFVMLNEPTLVDAGFNINIAGQTVDIRKYTPSNTSTLTFDGADQRLYDAGTGATVFDMNNVVFSGSGQKSLHYHGDDWYNVKGNLTINPGVTVYVPRRLDFNGINWTNNGTFNNSWYVINFNGLASQTIDPGLANDFYSVNFTNANKTFVTNGINVNNGAFIVDANVDMGSVADNLTHNIASERITLNSGTWATTNANFIFDRNGTQYLPAMTCKNMTFRKYDNWTRVRYLEGEISINDINIEEGTQLRCSQNAETTTPSYNVIMTGNFINDGRLYAWGNTIAFESNNTDPKIIKQGQGNFDFVTFNQINTSQRTYTIAEETRFYEDMTIGQNATLDINGQILRLGNDDPNDPVEPLAEHHYIQTGGTLDVDAGASLIFSCRDQNNPILDVSGTLKIVGTNGNNATITSTDWFSNLHRIDININNGGNVQAKYYLMKYLSNEGFYVDANATVDATNNFSDGTWSELNTGGGTYLYCNAAVTDSIRNVTFNYSGTPAQTTHFNVKRDTGLGNGKINFASTVSGLLAGEIFEADPVAVVNPGDITWKPSSEINWTGNISSDWFNPNNWSPVGIPDNSKNAIIPLRPNNPEINGAGAICKNLQITNGFLTLKAGNDLSISGDVYVGTGNSVAIMAVDNSGSSVTVTGNWTRSQNAVFVHGDGTVIFNAGSGSVSIDPRDSKFGNITFNGGASFMLNRNEMFVDDNFLISLGTVQPIANNYRLYIKGNYSNAGGNYDNTVHGTVFFNGVAQTINNADLWNVTIDGSNNKTTSGTCVINGNLVVENGILVGGNSIDMNNNVTIEATGGFNDGGFTHTFSGNRWIGTGAYAGTGIIEFDRAGSQYIRASKFNSLLLKNNGIVALEGDVDMTGDLSIIYPNVYLMLYDKQITNTSGTGTFSMDNERRVYVRGANNFPTGFNLYNLHENSYTLYDGTMAQTIAPVPVTYGRLYLNHNIKTAGGHLDINGILYLYSDVTLDVTGNNYRINLEGHWYNQHGANFIPHEGDVVFDGNDELTYMFIYEESKNTNPFYNLTVNKGLGDVRTHYTDITVQNNLRVISGRLYNSRTMYVGGDMSALSGTFYTSGTYYLNKQTGNSNLQLNGSVLNNLTVNSLGGATYFLQDDLEMNGNFNLIAGTFEGNGQYVRMGNYGEVQEISGAYKIGAGGTLALPSYGTLKVNSGGEIFVLGDAGNVATVTNYNGRYYFNIESGGAIHAANYLFEYMAEAGIYVKDGGIINSNYNFSYGTFTNPANGGTCLRIENNQSFTEAGANPILEVSFPHNPNGGASNVTKSLSVGGVLDFKDYSGEFAGEDYDNDPNNLINWISPPFVMWTGNVDNDWYKIGNWDVTAGPDRIPLISDNVLIGQRTNQPIIDVDGAVAKTINVQERAILTLSTNAATDTTLIVAQDVDFAGTIRMTTGSDTLAVGGNWNNTGMFTAGTGTVIFNSPFGIKSANNRFDYFYNLHINSGSVIQISRNTTVNNNFIIKNGTFDLAANNRLLTVKGNFLNNDNFTSQNSKIILAGTGANQLFKPGSSTYYNIDINANANVTLTNDNLSLRHNMNINSGTFNLNHLSFNLGDGGTDVLTLAGGEINIDDNAILKPANNASIEVNNGGVFTAIGTNIDNPAYMESQSGVYGFNVNSGGNIKAKFYNFKNTNTYGIRIKSGATIDPGLANNFSYGVWREGTSPGQYLWLENDFADFTTVGVYFHNGASVNVKRISGSGIITFEDALGLMSGYNFEEDIPAHGETTGKIHWTFTHDVYDWTGAVSEDWNVAGNWDTPLGHAVPDANAIARIPDVSIVAGGSGNFPVLGYKTTSDPDGSCYDLKIENKASLRINNGRNLDVDNTVIVVPGAALTIGMGSATTIKVGDMWAIDGTFTHGGNSTVIFDAPGGKLLTISGNSSFYNCEIYSYNYNTGTAGDAEYMTGTSLDIDGFFKITHGEFTVTDPSHILYVGGDFSNASIFNNGNGILVLDGANQNISNTGTGNVYNIYCEGNQVKTLTSDFSIENNLKIKSGATLNGGIHTLTLMGGWENRGTFIPSTGKVVFEGGGTQIIDNYSTETFYDFIVNNSSSTFPQILLYGNLHLTGTNWTMTDGIIETTATRLLTAGQSVILSGGNTDASYVNGPMAKEGNSNFVFPIGDGSKFARLGISDLSSAGTYLAQYYEAPYSDLTVVNPTLDHVSGYEHWTLNRTSGAGDGPFVTFYWEDGGQSGIDNLATLTTAEYNGTDWEDRGQGSPAPTILANDAIKSSARFSNFGTCGFGSTDSSNPFHAINKWIGTVSQDWHNLNNWSMAEVPTSSTNTLIPSTPTNQPVISTFDAEVGLLTIDFGAKLEVMPLKTLSTSGKFSINGTFRLNSDNTGNAGLINLGTISYGGSSTVETELYVSGGQYHYVSSPTTTTHTDRFKSDPVAPEYNPNFYSYVESGSTWNAAGVDWVEANGQMNIMQGYGFYSPSDITVNITSGNNSGIFNTGSKSKNLTYTGNTEVTGNPSTPDVIHRGWNFVGNPYPAHIDWADAGWTKTNLYNSIYFWNGANYSYYVIADGAQDNGVGTNIAAGTNPSVIPPMQGYFVKVKENAGDLDANTTGTLITPESARTTATQHFYKNGNDSETDIIRIKVSGIGNTDETVVRFLENSSSEFDADYDAFKLFPGDWYSVPQIYSVLSENLIASINTLPGYYDELIIPIGFQTPESGAFTIEIPEFNLGKSTEIFFEDIYDNKIYEISSGLTYNFSSDNGRFDDRFRIVFSVETDVEEISNDTPIVDIYSYGTDIYLKSMINEAIIGNVQIVNTMGTVVYQSNNTQESLARINFRKYASGTYIVKLTNKYGVFTGKVFVMKR